MTKPNQPTRLYILLAIFLIVVFTVPAVAYRASVEAQDSEDIPLFSKLELTFAIDAEIDNPYNPNQADVKGVFISPTSQRYEVSAFYMQPYRQTCTDDCSVEVLEANGAGEWRLRFTPMEVGRWRYTVSASIEGGNAEEIDSGRFTVSESDEQGFVRVADNQRYFEFDDGTSYFPVGQNLGWARAEEGGLLAYIEWLDKLDAVGANYARLNIDVPWFIGLEWQSPAGQYGGPGQEAAWRLDTILSAAEARGIYLQLTLIWHQAFVDYQGAPVVIPNSSTHPDQSVDFDSNPYNSRLAGSLNNPGGVFIDSVSQSLLQRRLHYINARWGYSTHVFAWEIVDSLDEMASFQSERDVAWLNNLITSLREVDIYGHLITVGMENYNSLVNAQADIDFAQARVYQNRPIESTGNQVELTIAAVSEAGAEVQRPVLLTEFSLNRWFEPVNDDPSGVHIQNTLWAAIFAGAAGSAMPYWWNTYLDPQDLYHQQLPVYLFTQDINWNSAHFELIEPVLTTEQEVTYESLRLEDFNRLFRSASLPDTMYHITASGVVPPLSLTTSYLYGRQFNAENSRPQTFVVTPSIDTELIIAIENVSTAADAQLSVQIDGQTRTTLDLTAGTRGLTLNFPLTAGEHVIVLDNLGQDWLQLDYLEIPEYRAPLRALAMTDYEMGTTLVWLQHNEYTWDTVLAEETIEPLNFTMSLPQFQNGAYRVEFWNPLTGQFIGSETVIVNDDVQFSVDLLSIDTQLALRIFSVGDTPMLVPPTPFPTRTPVADE